MKKNAYRQLLFGAIILGASTPANAITVQYAWADEFLGGMIHIAVDDNAGSNGGHVWNLSGGSNWAGTAARPS